MNGKWHGLGLSVMPLVCAGALALWALSYQKLDGGVGELEGFHVSHVSQGASAGAVKELTASVWRGQIVVGYFQEKLVVGGDQPVGELAQLVSHRVGWHRDYRPLCAEPVLGFTLLGDMEWHATNYFSPIDGARVGSEAYGIAGVPLWLVVAGSTGMWGVQLLVWIKRRQSKPGCCKACGYDLRGNVSGTCPECGAQVGEGRGSKNVSSAVDQPLRADQKICDFRLPICN